MGSLCSCSFREWLSAHKSSSIIAKWNLFQTADAHGSNDEQISIVEFYILPTREDYNTMKKPRTPSSSPPIPAEAP